MCVVASLWIVPDTLAQAGPDPAEDLSVLLQYFRPGCDARDYDFVVRNISDKFDYFVNRKGLATLTDVGPDVCSDATPCERSYTFEAIQLVPAEDCINGPPVEPGFPCNGITPIDCDNNENDSCSAPFPNCDPAGLPAGQECAWCSTIENAELVVEGYRLRSANPVEIDPMTEFPPPVPIICSGTNETGLPPISGARPNGFCDFESVCLSGLFSDEGCDALP